MVSFNILSRHSLAKLRKTVIYLRIAGYTAESGSGYVWNTGVQRCRYSGRIGEEIVCFIFRHSTNFR